ncbi:MAG: sulfite exporter TauE/SafE family protein [Cytophagales bacterium]|nr:sulfite exporter TauE/SafE family protein [Cytophagales bacterium]MDW8384655.1 sulfite exporter TauE/SafE family protein [Flammeovirgaceae bacterium]
MYYLAFLTGLIGSFHCLGMCGPIAFMVPSQRWKQRLMYQIGRLFSYSFLGSLSGFIGYSLAAAGLQQKISILTGTLLILYAILPMISSKPVMKFEWFFFTKMKPYFSKFFSQENAFSTLMIGVLNGFLPCGLVYTALLGATTMASFGESALYMTIFGLGTTPMLLAIHTTKKIIVTRLKNINLKYMLPATSLIIGIFIFVRGLNLGIPYLSPKVQEKQGVSCCSKKSL